MEGKGAYAAALSSLADANWHCVTIDGLDIEAFHKDGRVHIAIPTLSLHGSAPIPTGLDADALCLGSKTYTIGEGCVSIARFDPIENGGCTVFPHIEIPLQPIWTHANKRDGCFSVEHMIRTVGTSHGNVMDGAIRYLPSAVNPNDADTSVAATDAVTRTLVIKLTF